MQRRSRLYRDDGEDLVKGERVSITIVEPTEELQETGLLDRHGRPLMRKPRSRRPIGFGHAYEAS